MIQIGNNFGLLSPSTVFIGYANKRKIILLPLIVTHVKSLKIAPKINNIIILPSIWISMYCSCSKVVSIHITIAFTRMTVYI